MATGQAAPFAKHGLDKNTESECRDREVETVHLRCRAAEHHADQAGEQDRQYIRRIADVYTQQQGELDELKSTAQERFDRALARVASDAGVPEEVLMPRNTWSDRAAYDRMARKLAGMFHENFAKFAEGSGAEVAKAGPKVSG